MRPAFSNFVPLPAADFDAKDRGAPTVTIDGVILTAIEARVLDHHRRFCDNEGRPPSTREAARDLGLAGPSSVQLARDGIEKKGIDLARLPSNRGQRPSQRAAARLRRVVLVDKSESIDTEWERAASALEALANECADRGERERAGACLAGAEALRKTRTA